MLKIKNFILLLFLCNFCFGQYYSEISLDTLNRYDEKGRKTGFWVEFLDLQFNVTKKKEDAVFFWLAYHQENVRLYLREYLHLGFRKPSFRKKSEIEIVGNKPKEGEIVMLNGVYKLTHKSGISKEFNFNQGRILNETLYLDTSNRVGIYIDFERKYNNNPMSYYYIAYHKTNSWLYLKCYFVFKDGKWRGEECEDKN